MIEDNEGIASYAVIFCSQRTEDDLDYTETAGKMLHLAAEQDGFIRLESARDAEGRGITVSYWRDLDAIANWRQQVDHLKAQQQGREKWYAHYRVQICKIEREYEFEGISAK